MGVMLDLSHLSSRIPPMYRKAWTKSLTFPYSFFLSNIQSTHCVLPKTCHSIPILMLQKHFPLQFYFWFSFPSQGLVVLSSHLKKLIPPHRTQTKYPPSLSDSSLKLQLCHTVQLRTDCPMAQDRGNPKLNRLISISTIPSVLSVEMSFTSLTYPQKMQRENQFLSIQWTHTHKLFHKEEFFQLYPKKLWARLTHPH